MARKTLTPKQFRLARELFLVFQHLRWPNDPCSRLMQRRHDRRIRCRLPKHNITLVPDYLLAETFCLLQSITQDHRKEEPLKWNLPATGLWEEAVLSARLRKMFPEIFHDAARKTLPQELLPSAKGMIMTVSPPDASDIPRLMQRYRYRRIICKLPKHNKITVPDTIVGRIWHLLYSIIAYRGKEGRPKGESPDCPGLWEVVVCYDSFRKALPKLSEKRIIEELARFLRVSPSTIKNRLDEIRKSDKPGFVPNFAYLQRRREHQARMQALASKKVPLKKNK